jgi:hypothetical protein
MWLTDDLAYGSDRGNLVRRVLHDPPLLVVVCPAPQGDRENR